MRPILADALPIVQQLEEEGMEIVKMDFDILSDVKTAYRELHEAWNYGIIAFGDYRFEDIDIEVFKDVDGSWVAIKSDTEAIPQAGVTVEPSATGTYRIDIKAYKFKEGFETGHYGLIIFHE